LAKGVVLGVTSFSLEWLIKSFDAKYDKPRVVKVIKTRKSQTIPQKKRESREV